MATLVTAYNFNELSKQTQDEVIDNELDDLFLEIFHLPNVYEYPEDIVIELTYLFEKVDDAHYFIAEAKENKLIFNYFRSIIIGKIKDTLFIPKWQKTQISQTHQSVILIN